MQLLLTHGYFLSEDPHEQAIMKPYPPMGILYLSSYLKARGVEVSVFDTTFSSPGDFPRRLDDLKPAVAGIYTNILTRRAVLGMIRACGERDITIVLGGPDATNYPEQYLARGATVVVLGEGEETLHELLPELSKRGTANLAGIRGIAFRTEDGGVATTPLRPHMPNLDAQPVPDRRAVDLGRYAEAWHRLQGTSSMSIITARGCTYSCNWCSHSVFGYTHRRRSPERVAEELEGMVADYSPDMVWYADDVFTISRSWLADYARALNRRGLRVPFETTSREDRLDEETVALLAEMGCYRLWLGAESGSQKVLDAMGRRTNAGRAGEMIRLLKKHGIQSGVFIMLGYEGEEIADLDDTVRFLRDSNPDSFLTTLAYPVRGTPYYREVADRIVELKPWNEGSDRDLTVEGRRSRRFYSFATRWVVSEVSLARQLRSSRPDYLRVTRSFASAKLGRLGMMLTRFEREGAAR